MKPKKNMVKEIVKQKIIHFCLHLFILFFFFLQCSHDDNQLYPLFFFPSICSNWINCWIIYLSIFVCFWFSSNIRTIWIDRIWKPKKNWIDWWKKNMTFVCLLLQTNKMNELNEFKIHEKNEIFQIFLLLVW